MSKSFFFPVRCVRAYCNKLTRRYIFMSSLTSFSRLQSTPSCDLSATRYRCSNTYCHSIHSRGRLSTYRKSLPAFVDFPIRYSASQSRPSQTDEVEMVEFVSLCLCCPNSLHFLGECVTNASLNDRMD